MFDYTKQKGQILFPTIDLLKWNRMSLYCGFLLWIIMGLARLLNWIVLNDLQLLLLLALFVVIPLALPLVVVSKGDGLFERFSALVLFLQSFATLTGAVSLVLGMGLFAGAVAFAWFLFTGLLALVGLFRFCQAKRRSLPDTCLAVALLYLPIGGIWLVLARLGLQPLGFGVYTDLLTAVHFHFIALAALIITGLTGLTLEAEQRGFVWKLYRILASCMLIAPLLVALSITTTQVTGMHFLETVAACLFALCLILIAFLNLRFVVPTTTLPFARGLLLVSSTAVVFTMLAASAYALGNATGIWHITISQMVLIHGWVNALAFGLCGLLGWRLRGQRERL